MAHCIHLRGNEKEKSERENWSSTADQPQVHSSIPRIKSYQTTVLSQLFVNELFTGKRRSTSKRNRRLVSIKS